MPDGEDPPADFLEERPAFLTFTRGLLGRLDRFGTSRPWTHALGVTTALLGVYAVGFLTAWATGDFGGFVTFYAVPLVLAEIGWGIFSMDWLRDRYRQVLWEWRRNFGGEYRDRLDAHWKRLADEYASLRFTGPLMAICAGLILGVRVLPGFASFVGSIAQPVVSAPGPLFVYFLVLGVALGYVAGWGVHIIVEHMAFLAALARAHLNPYGIMTGESGIEAVANLSFLSSVSWFGAVALATGVLYRNLDVGSIALYLFAVAIGLVGFLVPQVYLHRMLVGAKSALEAEFQSLLPRDWQRVGRVVEDLRTMTVLNLIRSVDTIPEWPINITVIITGLIAAVLPIAVAAIGVNLGG